MGELYTSRHRCVRVCTPFTVNSVGTTLDELKTVLEISQRIPSRVVDEVVKQIEWTPTARRKKRGIPSPSPDPPTLVVKKVVREEQLSKGRTSRRSRSSEKTVVVRKSVEPAGVGTQAAKPVSRTDSSSGQSTSEDSWADLGPEPQLCFSLEDPPETDQPVKDVRVPVVEANSLRVDFPTLNLRELAEVDEGNEEFWTGLRELPSLEPEVATEDTPKTPVKKTVRPSESTGATLGPDSGTTKVWPKLIPVDVPPKAPKDPRLLRYYPVAMTKVMPNCRDQVSVFVITGATQFFAGPEGERFMKVPMIHNQTGAMAWAVAPATNCTEASIFRDCPEFSPYVPSIPTNVNWLDRVANGVQMGVEGLMLCSATPGLENCSM